MDLRPASQTVKGKGCATCLNLLNISNYLIFKGWGGSKLYRTGIWTNKITGESERHAKDFAEILYMIAIHFLLRKSEHVWELCEIN